MQHDENEDHHHAPRGVMERHVQTILTAVVAALLGWVGVSLLDLRDRTTRLEVQTHNVAAMVADGTNDRFRGADWRREKERLDDRYNALVRRVEALEEGQQRGRR